MSEAVPAAAALVLMVLELVLLLFALLVRPFPVGELELCSELI